MLATRALKFVQLGEFSAGRQASEGAEVAPGTATTLRALRNRPATARDDIPELLRDLTAFNLNEDLFNKNVRTARKGVAGGPSGMTHDHLRPLLESPEDLFLFFAVCDFLAKGQVPREAVKGINTHESITERIRRSARHSCRRGGPESHSQDHCATVGSNGEGRHSTSMHYPPELGASAPHMPFKP